MGIAARHAIAGAEASDSGQNVLLKALAPLEIRLFLPQLQKELANQGTHGCIALSRLDARVGRRGRAAKP